MHGPHTRRRLLQAGASLGLAGMAGCEGLDPARRTDGGTDAAGGTADEPVGAVTGALTADFVVWKDSDTVASVNGRTLETEFSGEAGRDDAEVIQVTLEALGDGGRVFVAPAVYELHDAIHVTADRTELVSAQAHLRFHDHRRVDGDPDLQSDLVIHGQDHVRVRGLVVDGNRGERTTPTRTIDLAESHHAVFEGCRIRGGKADRAGAGYGIGGPYDSDHTVVHNCVVEDNDRHGLHPNVRSSGLRVINCTFRNNGWADRDVGGSAIAGHAGSDVVIANNLFAGNARGYHTGGDRLDRAIVSDNVFVDNGDEAGDQVRISEMTGAVTLRGNVFGYTEEGPAESGTHLLVEIRDGRGGTVTVAGNHFMDGGDGIATTVPGGGRLGKLLVSENLFERSRGPVVRVEGVATAVVRNNTVDPDHRGSLLGGARGVGTGVVSDNVVLGGHFDEARDGELIVEGNYRL